MPPKAIFSDKEVLNAALDVIRAEGMKSLTARNVADKLNSSTAPVYSYFSSMNDLKLAALRSAKELLLEYCGKPYTERVFLNVGLGYIKFAKEEKNLYRALFLEDSVDPVFYREFTQNLFEISKKDARFDPVDDSCKLDMVEKMLAYAHGLASQVVCGLIGHDDDEYIRKNLLEVGGAVIIDIFARKGLKYERMFSLDE